MKAILLGTLLFHLSPNAIAQNDPLQQLPKGTYQTVLKEKEQKWEKGDIVLLDNSHYQLGGSGETGEYRFSAAAQKIFFTSGPLKMVIAKTLLHNNKPSILLPAQENQNIGIALANTDVIAVLHKQ